MNNNDKKKNSVTSLLLRYGLPVVISVGLCWVLFTRVDFHENIEIVRDYCHWQWIALALALSVCSHVIRALRWGLQLDALGIKVPLMSLVWSIFGTYAVNLVFPRLGEVWRTGYIARLKGVSFTRVFGSMVSDRVADMLTVILITGLTFILAAPMFMDYLKDSPDRLASLQGLLSSPWLWTAVGVVVIGAWLLLTRMSGNKAVAKVKEMIGGLWEGFIVVVKMPRLWLWLIYTVMLWGCYFVQLYVAFYAFDFTTQILHDHGMIAALVCFLFSTISMILPSNGGYGPWQMAVIFGLSFYSAGVILPAGKSFMAMSVGFANCVMTTQTILLIILGLITFSAIAIQKRHVKA